MLFVVLFFFQAEDGIRDLVRSRGLGDVYKRQKLFRVINHKLNLILYFNIIVAFLCQKIIGQSRKDLSLIHI